MIKDNYFKVLMKAIFVAHTFIVIYDLLFAWGVLVGIEIPNIYTVSNPFTISSYGTRMNFVNLNSLTFTTPVLFILIIGKYDMGISRVFQTIVLILTFFLLIISGRRSVILIVIILPLMPFLFSGFFSKELRKNIAKGAAVFFVFFILTYLYVDKYHPRFISNYKHIFLKAFNSKKEPIKYAQQKMLFTKFKEKPLFGHGSGEMFYEPPPGRRVFANQFELSYHSKLAYTGIFGFIVIVGVYFWILFYGVFIARKKNDLLFLSFLVGYFFLLIADGTNPVLCSFDLIWPIYLCLARINYWEIKKTNINEVNFVAKN